MGLEWSDRGRRERGGHRGGLEGVAGGRGCFWTLVFAPSATGDFGGFGAEGKQCDGVVTGSLRLLSAEWTEGWQGHSREPAGGRACSHNLRERRSRRNTEGENRLETQS